VRPLARRSRQPSHDLAAAADDAVLKLIETDRERRSLLSGRRSVEINTE
jgi:hypothetical protein